VRGMVVLFGQASGVVPPVDPSALARASLYFTRPSFFHYVGAREELVASATRLFEVVSSGAVKIDVAQTYALRDAAAAHSDLEARKTTGSSVLIP